MRKLNSILNSIKISILFLFLSFGTFAQTETSNPYMDYKANHTFNIQESTDSKSHTYTVLTEVHCIDPITKEETILTIEEFIARFKAGALNHNSIQIQRTREGDSWYKLGNSGYILVGYAESKIASDYNNTSK
jgi:hypothetical protein